MRGETFADRLRNARLAMGWTQPQLADKLDVSNGTVGNWESNNLSRPRPETLRKIANLFEVEVSDFLGTKRTEGDKMYSLQDETVAASGEFPTAQKCREHLEKFLATCDRPELLGWTYYELSEKFPLNKFKKDEP